MARPPGSEEAGEDGDVDSSLEDFVILQSSRYHRPHQDSGTSDLLVRTRDLAPMSSDSSLMINEVEGVTEGARAPPNTANEIDLTQAGPDPEFEVILSRSIRSFVSDLADASRLDTYTEEVGHSAMDLDLNTSDQQNEPSPEARSPALDLDNLFNSSLLLSQATSEFSPPHTGITGSTNLSENVITIEPIIPGLDRGAWRIGQHVDDSRRSRSCPNRPSPPRVPLLMEAEASDSKRKRNIADMSTVETLDEALLEAAATDTTSEDSAHPPVLTGAAAAPQRPPVTSPPSPISPRPHPLSRLRPLPRRTSCLPARTRSNSLRLPGDSATMVSPPRGEQVVPRAARPATKRVRRHRD